MQNNKGKGRTILTAVFIVLIALIAVLFVGAGISATQDNKQNKTSIKKYQGLDNENTREEKSIETPTVFRPTERVTADQAVAFPTDI